MPDVALADQPGSLGAQATTHLPAHQSATCCMANTTIFNDPQFTVTIPAELGDQPVHDVGTFELTTE